MRFPEIVRLECNIRRYESEVTIIIIKILESLTCIEVTACAMHGSVYITDEEKAIIDSYRVQRLHRSDEYCLTPLNPYFQIEYTLSLRN